MTAKGIMMEDGNETPLRLALLRHANALWPLPGETDFDRRLSNSGILEAQQAGHFLHKIEFSPEVVLTSPASRCVQTLELVQQSYGTSFSTKEIPQLYNSSRDDYLDILNQNKNFTSILLVGHNPTLEGLVAGLIGSDLAYSEMQRGFETGACVIINIKPAQMRAIGAAEFLSYFAPVSED
jgi:phosphohistidine phosphatase